MGRSCAIFFYEGWVGVSPTIVNLSRALDRAGYSVTIYGSRTSHPAAPSVGAKSRVLYLRGPADLPGGRWAMRILRRVGPGSASAVELLFYAAQCVIRSLAANSPQGTQKSLSIGVDTRGAIVALLWWYLKGTRYAYLSLELRDPRKRWGLSAFINPVERVAYRKADIVIVQDGDRLRTLNSYLHFDHPTAVYLPNSPGGLNTRSAPQRNFFRDRFTIPEAKFPVIALQAGTIAPWSFSEELAKAFAAIDRGVALVLHENRPRRVDDKYIRRVRAANRTNLFLSLAPVRLDQVDDVFASATIGLAFYRDINSNLSQISMASGKLAYYLKHGKPVLVSNTASLANFVKRSEAGLVINDPTDPAELQSAIDVLLRDYERFSSKARAVFDDHLDFDHNVKPVLARLDSVAHLR